MSESASARPENPAADNQGPRWLWSDQPQEPASPPQEQVAGPSAGGRHAVSVDSIPAGPATERCWLCGIRQATYMLMADGGSACADVRWYCRDARACTSRWTVQRIRRLESGEPAPAP